ncbi:hypothetical protein ZWY2020_037921 [Hordeum vulgare]|nr:hypothetical protein ZWY2020_037921 [Hordeum vulgare]
MSRKPNPPILSMEEIPTAPSSSPTSHRPPLIPSLPCSSLPPPREGGLPGPAFTTCDWPAHRSPAPATSRSRSCSNAVASSEQATADHTLPEKTLGAYSTNGGFPWSNAMLQRQRTGFHFQPEKNYITHGVAPGKPPLAEYAPNVFSGRVWSVVACSEEATASEQLRERDVAGVGERRGGQSQVVNAGADSHPSPGGGGEEQGLEGVNGGRRKVGEGGGIVGISSIERRGALGLRDVRLPLDKAVWPFKPATNDAVSPVAFCGPVMRGGLAAQRDIPPPLQPYLSAR